MKGWADVLLLSVLLLLTFVLFFSLALGIDTKEWRVSHRQAEIAAVKGAYELLLRSLETTWNQIGADAILKVAEDRFGMPLYLYKYDPSAATSPPTLGEGAVCSGNPMVCMPDNAIVKSKLTELFKAATLPSRFKLSIKIGRTGTIEPSVELGAEPGEFNIAPDRASGVVSHSIKIEGGSTFVDAAPSIKADVSTQFSKIVAAARSAISSASSMHSGMWLIQAPGWQTSIRTSSLTALDEKLQALLAQSRNLMDSATLAADMRASTSWKFAKPALRLGYDSGVRLIEGLQGDTSTLARCKEGWEEKQFLYNRFSGAIEAAMPDLLRPYIEEPRALLAAIADERGWQADDTFGGGVADAGQSAIRKVSKLLDEFKSGSVSLPPSYSAWKEKCTFGSGARLLNSPLERPNGLRIVGCFGDRRCSGGEPAVALGEAFYSGIDVMANEGEPVYAMEGGTIIASVTTCRDNSNCPSYGFFEGIGNYVIIRHMDIDGNEYYTVYGHLKSVVLTSGTVLGGQVIGYVGKTGKAETAMLHVRVSKQVGQQYVNPCLYIGCMPATPQTEPTVPSLPKPLSITSPQDYALMLSAKNDAPISLGDDFCAPSDRGYRNSNLGYGFYSTTTSRDFAIWPAFEGTVTAIKDDESGCGSMVYVDSGEFVTIYSGVNPAVNVNDKTGPWRRLGYVATSPAYKCINPHLTVVFALPNFTMPMVEYDRCGKRLECAYDKPARCDVGKYDEQGRNCVVLPDVPGAPRFVFGLVPEQYCAALEWPSRRVASGWFWKRTSTFEQIPLELGFRLSDSFVALDCSQHDKQRFTWLNPKDLVCNGSALLSCGIAAAEGVSSLSPGQYIGENATKQTCVELVVRDVPQTPRVALPALNNRRITKFCLFGEEKTDWVCCAGQGGSPVCPTGAWTFVNGELICDSSSADCQFV